MIILLNPYDQSNIEFARTLTAEHCKLWWYGSSQEEAIRLVNMYLSGAMEGLAPPEPEIKYTDEDIARGSYPQEFQRWIMQCCDKHRGKSYIGPCPRAFPSVIKEMPDGSLALWDCPQSIEDCREDNISWSCRPGECVGGQWLEGALQTAKSPHYSNHIIRTAVANFIKEYNTIYFCPRDRELVELKQRKVNGTNSFI